MHHHHHHLFKNYSLVRKLNIHFSALWFNTVGDYHYTVREVKGDETGGMDYDETVYNVTVKVDTELRCDQSLEHCAGCTVA